MKKLFYFVFAIIALYSCNSKEPTNLFEMFKTVKELSGESICFDKILGNPNQVVLIDSLLLLNDSDNDYLVSLLDPSKGIFLRRLCKIGRGPEEFVKPVEISVDKKNETVNIYERSSQRLSHLKNFSTEVSHYITQNRVSFSNDQGYTGFVRKIGDSTYIGVGQFDKRYAFFDLNGELLSTTQDYPNYPGINISDDLSYVAYQNILEVNTVNKYLVAASVFCDNIEFFRFDANNLNLLTRYDFIKPEFIDKSNNSNKILHPSDSNKMGFLNISSDEKFVYCLYSGRCKNDYETMAQVRKGVDVFVFDWKGNPIVRYKLNQEIINFTVDSDRKILYAITHAPEPIIMKFKF